MLINQKTLLKFLEAVRPARTAGEEAHVATIIKLAEKLGCEVYKEGVGLFVWAKLPAGITSAEDFIDKILYEKYIFITPGTIFGSNGEGYIRFALCVKEEKIEEAIRRF